ncbi:unnamed protein product [Symbiodinium necroappetens]|uniref:Uncharacterized protein n=1 Tax=Symbiodinium necroappetens TaxID=1628268 RepID=A0A812J0V9_9DINO|nr:unnamed protein product [Symbiodinium necroappetens]
MDASAIAVIVVASILGAFCRAATGFGGSILFILVHLARYSLANQLHLASGLESAVLMVVLGTVFEFSTSTVLFLAVARRNLLLLSVPGQTGENKSILEMVKTFLNLTFALVALFKITMEFRAYAKARRANEALHITEVLDEDVDTELCKKMGIQFILVGFSCGFLNGLVGLPGPLMMVHFAQALSNKKMTANTCYTLTQAFFMLTTVMRFNTTLLLRCVIALLLLSSLMGLGILESSALGFWALGPLAKKGAEPGEPGVTLFWLLLTVSASCHASDPSSCADMFGFSSVRILCVLDAAVHRHHVRALHTAWVSHGPSGLATLLLVPVAADLASSVHRDLLSHFPSRHESYTTSGIPRPCAVATEAKPQVLARFQICDTSGS